MATQQFEIEVKSLLGAPEAAETLLARMKEIDPACTMHASSSQLNHYFEGGDPRALYERMKDKIAPEEAAMMEKIASDGQKISVRTRDADGTVRIVMKASIGSDSSENGVMRVEVDAVVPGMTLEELDSEVLAAGYTYQAKWSRKREEYRVQGIDVCVDRNAGYGYLAEFEKVVGDESEAEAARAQIDELMGRLGVRELPQDRLERMFAHYNANWPEYYGTDKVFIIE